MRMSRRKRLGGRLGVVIGPGGRDIAQADAMKHVWGYTVVNDVSWRDLQRRHGGQWQQGQSLDGSCPMGAMDRHGGRDRPCHLAVACRRERRPPSRNRTPGTCTSRWRSSRPLAGHHARRRATSSRPDARGRGFARTPAEFMKPGDLLETEIEGIGTMRKPHRLESGQRIPGTANMVTKIQQGRRPRSERMPMYSPARRPGAASHTTPASLRIAAFVGGWCRLAIFIVYLLLSRTDWNTMYPVLAALVLACFHGLPRTNVDPARAPRAIDLTAETLRAYIDSRKLPDLPVHFPDRAGRLMEGTQYTSRNCNETIKIAWARLHTDDSPASTTAGPARSASRRKSRAPSATCSPSSSRSSTSPFQEHQRRARGTARGDACISHVAALLQLNTARRLGGALGRPTSSWWACTATAR